MKNIERENNEESDERPYVDSTSYPDEEELSILGMDENFEQSGKQRPTATRKSYFDFGKYISQQEPQKYTHRELIRNSSRTNKEQIQVVAKPLNYFSLSLSEYEVIQIVEDYYEDNLKEFLGYAIERNLEVLESGDIEQGQYRSPCWQFVSELRGHPFFRGLSSNEAVSILDRLINWQDLPDYDVFGEEADPEDELIDAWNYQDNHQIKPLYPSVHPETVLSITNKYPLTNSKVKSNYCMAVSILYWYARLMNQDGWFFLSAGKLAELLDCSKRSAAIYMRRATSEGYIQKHIEYAKKDRQATEYIWVGEIINQDENIEV